MPDIKHILKISTTSEKVYRAITETDGIKGWWTTDVDIKPEVNSVAEFNFGNFHNRMKIVDLKGNRFVEWKCIEGDKEWVNTNILFKLKSDNGKTQLKFEHNNWRADTEFFAMCNYNWAWYLTSLKDYCEKGIGTPYPHSIGK